VGIRGHLISSLNRSGASWLRVIFSRLSDALPQLICFCCSNRIMSSGKLDLSPVNQQKL